MGITIASTQELSPREYELIRQLVYAKSGINLGDKKKHLVRSRLGKIVRKHGMDSFREYYDYVVDDPNGERLCELLDAISTNTTHLFREERHFTFLKNLIQQLAVQLGRSSGEATIRIWSAACSSGEEPHSIAIVAHTELLRHPSIQLKILATDISVEMLRRAQQGLYTAEQAGKVSAELRRRYFQEVCRDGETQYQIAPELQRLIKYARFNLMATTFPFRNQFDIIFCRNVMIYFDKKTQEQLVGKFCRVLRPGGYLMIGHSESLHGIAHTLTQVEPATYTSRT